MEFVTGKDDIPYMKIKSVWNHQPHLRPNCTRPHQEWCSRMGLTSAIGWVTGDPAGSKSMELRLPTVGDQGAVQLMDIDKKSLLSTVLWFVHLPKVLACRSCSNWHITRSRTWHLNSNSQLQKKTQPVSKYLEHILFPFPWLWNEPQITLRWGTSAWRARAKDPPPWLPAMRRNGGRSSQWLNWGLYSYGPTNSYIQMGLFILLIDFNPGGNHGGNYFTSFFFSLVMGPWVEPGLFWIIAIITDDYDHGKHFIIHR